jgi:hypothetical protein
MLLVRGCHLLYGLLRIFLFTNFFMRILQFFCLSIVSLACFLLDLGDRGYLAVLFAGLLFGMFFYWQERRMATVLLEQGLDLIAEND